MTRLIWCCWSFFVFAVKTEIGSHITPQNTILPNVLQVFSSAIDSPLMFVLKDVVIKCDSFVPWDSKEFKHKRTVRENN